MPSDFTPAPTPPAPLAHPPGGHWVVPYASSLSEPCLRALPEVGAALPNLRALLARLAPVAELTGDEYALTMPHERVMARALGWHSEDGRVPWAAWWAAHDGVALAPGHAWGLLSPGHWLMGRDHLTVLDPDGLGLDNAGSQALLEAVRPLFEDDGWQLAWGAAHRWYAAHPALAELPTASLDRVVGRNPDVWLTDHPLARGVRRLQSEVQMLLYEHPINDARTAQGLLTVNSFWLSGVGPQPAPAPLPDAAPPPKLVHTLRAPLLSDDMAGWQAAWALLDRTLIAELLTRTEAGEPVHLTLCGERHAVRFGPPAPAGWRDRLRAGWRRVSGAPAGDTVSARLAAL